MADEQMKERLRAEFEGVVDGMLDAGFTDEEIRAELVYLLEQR